MLLGFCHRRKQLSSNGWWEVRRLAQEMASSMFAEEESAESAVAEAAGMSSPRRMSRTWSSSTLAFAVCWANGVSAYPQKAQL